MANDEDTFDDDVARLFGGDDDEAGGPVVEGSEPMREESGEESSHQAPGHARGESDGVEGEEMQYYQAAARAGRRQAPLRRRRFAQKRQRRVVPEPKEPTKAQREEHELSHIPLRVGANSASGRRVLQARTGRATQTTRLEKCP